jgi:hypothetical protein
METFLVSGNILSFGHTKNKENNSTQAGAVKDGQRSNTHGEEKKRGRTRARAVVFLDGK